MSDEVLHLIAVRQELRNAVLTAIMARDGAAQISAWQEVDQAAIALARERRRYDKYVKQVCANANALLPDANTRRVRAAAARPGAGSRARPGDPAGGAGSRDAAAGGGPVCGVRWAG